jgi:hypothetical protein
VVIKTILSQANYILGNAFIDAKRIWCLKASFVFKLTLIFILLPGIGALINLNIYHLPIFIGGFALLSIYATNANSFSLHVPKNLEIPAFVLFVLLMAQILTDRGFGILSAGGYMILMAIILFGILSAQKPSIETIVRWISLIFQVLMVGIGIELIIILLGKQSSLTELFYSEVTTHYKNYNPADLIHFMGLAMDSGGPNSPLLGSQIGGMVCLFSTLWFFLIPQLQNDFQENKRVTLWRFISIILLLATMNGTAALLTALGISIPYFLSKNKQQKVNALILILLFFVALFFLISQGYIFERIFSNEPASFSRETLDIFLRSGLEAETKDIAVIDFYFFIFFRPVEIWLNSDFLSQILGSGNELFLNEDIYIGGDFGFGSEILLKTGLIWACTFSWAVLSTCFSIYSLPNKLPKSSSAWLVLAKINALFSFLWLASLIHYTPAIQNAGGYSLFGLSLALVIYCKHCAIKLLENENAQSS